MAGAARGAFDLHRTYIHLDGPWAATIDVSDSFWQELMTRDYRSAPVTRVGEGGGWLVTSFHMSADTPTWEMHPEGDEVLHLVSGEMDVVLEEEGGRGRERVIPLRAGSTCIVPRGAWHRQIVRVPSDLLAVTFGRGSQHRPV
jgi:mannose-6-phosphate isomerase-like protein (cupin superfamily)